MNRILRPVGGGDAAHTAERAEAQHMQIIGDTSGGKTTIMLQILRQDKTSWRFSYRLRPSTGVRSAFL